MFAGLTHSAHPVIDPLQERDPPPFPTVVVFPHEKLSSNEAWIQHPPDIYHEYSKVSKPSDLTSEHLQALNLEIQEDVALEDFVPPTDDGLKHLPPQEWGKRAYSVPNSRRNSAASYEIFAHDRYPLLSNGHHAPELDTYVKFVNELYCDTDDGFRAIGRLKPRPGHKTPSLTHYRKFWGVLDTVSTYWDSSMDHYFDGTTRPVLTRNKSSFLQKFHVGHHKHPVPPPTTPAPTKASVKRYRGRRTDTGSNMPDHIRSDCIRNFIEPVASAFHCTIAVPRKGPQIKVKNMLVPVTQSVIVWRNPQDKAQKNNGVLEGPLLGVQCRKSTNFSISEQASTCDAAREIGGLLLLAQERAREGKVKEVPGLGQWYTSKPRWGGGPGGEFGDGDKNKQGIKSSIKTSNTSSGAGGMVSLMYRPSEEFTWKQLKPSAGLWEQNKTYLAVGKERGSQYDNVFMISALFHHIAIVKLTVHPLYLEWLNEGNVPKTTPDNTWFSPVIQRTKWYDLFNPEDRAEAMRGLWGVFSYMMRAGPAARRPMLGERQRSEIAHKFNFRKTKHEVAQEDDLDPPRSQSLY